MAYKIELTGSAVRELEELQVFDRRRIVAVVKQQLVHEPAVTTRHRKRLDEVSPDFEHVPPIWQLRVGDFRVIYDVDEARQIVFVRAVRRKSSHQTTEDILR